MEHCKHEMSKGMKLPVVNPDVLVPDVFENAQVAGGEGFNN